MCTFLLQLLTDRITLSWTRVLLTATSFPTVAGFMSFYWGQFSKSSRILFLNSTGTVKVAEIMLTIRQADKCDQTHASHERNSCSSFHVGIRASPSNGAVKTCRIRVSP